MLQTTGSLQHSPEDEVKLLLHELALQSPTLVLGSLPSQPSFHTLYNRWTKLPGMASQKASDQSFRQQIQAGPRLMQLPHLFQVMQSKCVKLCRIRPALACRHEVLRQLCQHLWSKCLISLVTCRLKAAQLCLTSFSHTHEVMYAPACLLECHS